MRLLAVLGAGVVDPATPVLRADDAGVTRGDGCFEGLRVVADAGAHRVDKLDAHLARMARSAAALEIAFDEAAWRDARRRRRARPGPTPGEAAMKLRADPGCAGAGPADRLR